MKAIRGVAKAGHTAELGSSGLVVFINGALQEDEGINRPRNGNFRADSQRVSQQTHCAQARDETANG